VIPGANSLPAIPYLSIAEIALIVARLSCREAGVETVFSRLGLVFGDHRCSFQDDLIAALFVIRLHGIPNVPESYQVLDNIGRDLNTRVDGERPHEERSRGPPSLHRGDTNHRLPGPDQGQPGEGRCPGAEDRGTSSAWDASMPE
jgi:hypothetical protein